MYANARSLSTFTHLDLRCVHSLYPRPISRIILTVITRATALFTHSCWCPCVTVRPGGMQKLEYDQAPGCDEKKSALLFLAVEETELDPTSRQRIIQMIY